MRGGLSLPASPVETLEPAFRKLGLGALVTFGTSVLLLAAASLGELALILSNSGSLDARGVALYTLLVIMLVLSLVQGVALLFLGRHFGSRPAPRTMAAYVLMQCAAWILFAVVLLVSSSDAFAVQAVFLMVAGVLFIVAALVYLAPSASAKLVAGILGVVGLSLFVAAPQTSPFPNVGLSVAVPFTFLAAFGGVPAAPELSAGMAGALQVAAAFAAAAVAIVYAYLKGHRFEPVIAAALAVAALLFTIALVVGGLGSLTSTRWGSFTGLSAEAATLLVLVIVALVVFTVSGFLGLTASALGLATAGQRLGAVVAAGPRPAVGQVSQANPASGFCGNCGKPLRTGAKFCGACGAKVERDGQP